MAFPIPLRTFVVEGSGCSNLFVSMLRLLSDEAYGGHMKRILATTSTSLFVSPVVASQTRKIAIGLLYSAAALADYDRLHAS
jgi:hypothetical protein